MREEYDFSNGIKNPYAKQLKQQVTINLNVETVNYFKDLAASTGIPYQTLINLELRDCAEHGRRPSLSWN